MRPVMWVGVPNDLHWGLATIEAYELFTRMQADLAKTMPDQHVREVLCPLCLVSFRREDLEGPDPPLTIEHILPDKLGGTRTTLTCKRCNNTQGSTIDAHLIRRIRSHNALAGSSNTTPIHGRLECEGRKLGITFQMIPSENGEMVRNIQLKGGPPDVLKRFGQRLASGDLRDISFTLSLDYIEERSLLAMIRIAYLSIFAQHGYGYILGEGPSVIRKILAGEIPAREHEIWRIADQLERCEFSDSELQLESLITSFVSRQRVLGHMVVFRIDQGTPRYFAVLLPARDEPVENVIVQLHTLSDSIKGQPLSFTLHSA